MDQREETNQPALSFSIDNILRDDFAKSAKERAPYCGGYSPRAQVFHGTMAACNECCTSRYRPVYFCTTASTLVDKGTMLRRANNQINCTRKPMASSSNGQESTANQSSVNDKPVITPNKGPSQDIIHQTKTKQDTSTKAEKKKRFRSHFSQLQLQYLESIFARQHYLSRDERTLLANALDMTELQVRNWFQNKRYQKRHREIQALQKVGKQVPVQILVAERRHVSPTLGVRSEEMRY